MMNFSDKEIMLKEFPNVKLSYGGLAHKKVYNAELYLAIPEGKKCFAWFTTFNDNNVCFIMENEDNKQIKNIKIVNVCFSDELSYGTILYGTVFRHSENSFFCIEDIFMFKGKHVETENWGNKLFIFYDLLKNNLKQVSYNNSFLVFGLPITCNNINDIMKSTENVKYNISSIQFRFFNSISKYSFMNYVDFIRPQLAEQNIKKEQYKKFYNNDKDNISRNTDKRLSINVTINTHTNKKEAILNVKPDLQQDIYHLYCLSDNAIEKYVGLAGISDYKTSVMMNKLFRIIKENDNLDALEESDDEEEFENEKEDLFVHLDREYKMVCVYNHKFKKWCPIKLADCNSKITLAKNLYMFDKNLCDNK